MNDTTRAEWNLANGLWSTDGERFEEVFGTAHGASVGASGPQCEVLAVVVADLSRTLPTAWKEGVHVEFTSDLLIS